MSRNRNDAAKTEAHLLQAPENAAGLEKLLRSGKLALGGFMGWDDRELYEVIAEDVRAVWAADRSIAEVAARMTKITKEGIAALGNPAFSGDIEIVAEENKGLNLCPWECSDILNKRVTSIRKGTNSKPLLWSDLSIHMIRKHGFFGGKGSSFRLEPKELIDLIF